MSLSDSAPVLAAAVRGDDCSAAPFTICFAATQTRSSGFAAADCDGLAQALRSQGGLPWPTDTYCGPSPPGIAGLDTRDATYYHCASARGLRLYQPLVTGIWGLKSSGAFSAAFFALYSGGTTNDARALSVYFSCRSTPFPGQATEGTWQLHTYQPGLALSPPPPAGALMRSSPGHLHSMSHQHSLTHKAFSPCRASPAY